MINVFTTFSSMSEAPRIILDSDVTRYPTEPKARLQAHMKTAEYTRRERKIISSFLPLLFLGTAIEVSGMAPQFPPNAPPIAQKLHTFTVYLCTALCGYQLLVNGKRRQFTEDQILDMMQNGELEPTLKQLLIENPEERERLQEIAVHFYGIRFPEGTSAASQKE